MAELIMKKINSSTLEYPIVIRKVLNDLVLSVPDLGYWKTLPLESAKTSTDLDDLFLKKLSEALVDTWSEIEHHQQTKKWIPTPSTFKQSIQKSEEDLTLPEFTKQLSKHMTISENTVRREIQRGVIQCYQTEGGHRRIPFAELEIYLAKIRTNKDLKSLEPAKP